MPSPAPSTLRARPRDLMLVDLDCFFVSVERQRDPALCGRPVIVGGLPGERGVVACASYEARRHGVRAGMPIFQAQQRLPADETVYLRGDHAGYMQASAQVMAILERFTPAVEPLSLDEALLDMAGCELHHRSWLDAAHDIRATVLAETGLPISIGIGGTRAVTHVATSLAKPGGILEVLRGEEAAFLAPLALSHLPGVGPRLLKSLERFHLRTIGDLAAIPQDVLEETFGRMGTSISQRARGMEAEQDGPAALSPSGLPQGGRRTPRTHSISRETSFARDTCDPIVIDGMLSHLAQRAGQALREEGGLARAVGVRLRFSDFRTVEARSRLLDPTDRDEVILSTVRSLWPKRYDRRVALRLVGVLLADVVPAQGRQLHLFEDLPQGAGLRQDPGLLQSAGLGNGSMASSGASGASPPARRSTQRLDETVDRIRERHGFGAVVRGRAIGLLEHLPTERSGRTQRGFQLRTPGCSR